MEAQRVMAVMDDALNKLTLLSYVPIKPRQELLDALAQAGANPAKACLQTQWRLEQSAAKAGALSAGDVRGTGMRPSAGPGDNGDNPEGDGEQLEQVYASTRALCRSLKQNAAAAEIIYALQRERDPPMLYLKQRLGDLTTIMHRRISTTGEGAVKEDGAVKVRLQGLTEREKVAESERDSLQQTLAAARTDRDREVNALDAAIKKLRLELQEFTSANASEAEALRKKAEDAVAHANEDHGRKMKALRDKLDSLDKDIAALHEAHQEEEALARKKKIKAEGECETSLTQSELAAVVAKYDDSMISGTASIERLEKLMSQEAKELAELKEHFDRVDANAARAAAEDASLAAISGRVARAYRVLDTAAATIQAAYRGKRARAEVSKMKKKGKKGKKGGKKK
ncbi:hypothetical protein JKP88DRAFT_346432 [Tribonema minus]|uniref:Dynein regulatory complex protein 10 n=1 Tax=Tribonema minus TaxID=303371 RepID=A0A835ZLC1_9STRA|nr:hypothetical protein JKP88DRAFT_346432 [Tribonema minus]